MFGIMAIVPCIVLLTVSYFVLFVREKTDDKMLKTFGLVVAILLWVGAGLVLGAGIARIGGEPQGHCSRAGFERMGMHAQRGVDGPCQGMRGMHGMRHSEEAKDGGCPRLPQTEETENQDAPKK